METQWSHRLPDLQRSGRARRLQLLAIDDDPFYQRIYKHLGAEHFDVLSCLAAGPDAARLALSADCVILDLAMPDKDGIQFITDHLAQLHHEHPDLHLIICSAQPSRVIELARRVALLVGIRHIDAFAKPFDHDAMMATLVSTASIAPVCCELTDDTPINPATVAQLRMALTQRQLVPYWQPQISAANGEITGIEVLSRWHHPTAGVLTPLHFITAIESEEFGQAYTLYILEQALMSIQRWAELTGFRGRLAVNTPPAALMAPEFVESLMQLLEQYHFPAQRLVLEVTEHTAARNDSALLAGMARVMMQDIQLSIDDFGTGHSSLHRLGTDAFKEIKIDKSFITELQRSPAALHMTGSIIRAAQSMGLRIVAEGVGDAETARRLLELGCTELQGALYTMPLDEETLIEWIRHYQPASLRYNLCE